MISGQKIGRRQIDYYVAYLERGGASRWLGQGAAVLGVAGSVESGDFRALAAGQRPDGTRLLERVPEDRTPGWDFTFSAPKSVSLAWALGDDGRRRVIEAAHDAAVAESVGFLESTGGRARRGLGGRDGHVQASLTVAAFVHPTSRELDPQLHTHALVLNVGHGEDGRWTAIDSRTLYAHRRAAASVYRAELRARLADAGARWVPPDRRGLSEMVGADREVLRAFSQRRVEIEASLAEHATRGRAAAQAACLATRAHKVDVELAELAQEWRERADKLGWDQARTEALFSGPGAVPPPSDDELAAIAERMLGPGGLTRDRAAFTRDDVITAWAEALPQGALRPELEARADRTLARGDVVPLVVADEKGNPLTTSNPHRGTIVRLVRAASGTGSLIAEPRYSTAEMLAVEARLFAAANDGRNTGAGSCPSATIEDVLARRAHLSDEQAAMVRRICSSGDRVEVVVGVPGSGKTFGLEAAHAIWQSAGYRVLGASLAAEAAAQLQAGSGIPATTLDSLFLRLGLGQDHLGPNTVVVIDEGGMVDTRRLGRLVGLADAAGAKIVLTGDDRQLPAVEAGGAFAALARRLGALRLTDNGRQIAPWQRDALVALREGRAGEAAGAYWRHGNVHTSESPAELIAGMVERWWTARQGGDDAALFTYSREAAHLLNALARDRVEAAGGLVGPELVIAEHGPADLGARRYRAGDEIRCLRNRSRLGAARDPSGEGLRNGTRGVVESVDPDAGELSLRTLEGNIVRLPADYVRQHTDWGYAWTLHKGQGRTLGQAARSGVQDGLRRRGRAFIYGADSLSAEAALVASSRAADTTEIFLLTDADRSASAAELAQSWARSEAKTTATEELQALSRIAGLAAEPLRNEILRRRADLAEVVGAGPGGDPDGMAEEVRHRVGLAAVHLDAILHDECDARRRLADDMPVGPGADADGLRTLRRLRASAEREARTASAESDATDAFLERQAAVRARHGADIHSALEEIETIDSALATRRKRHLDSVFADAPDYVTGVLGLPPQDRAGRLRWQQGVVEIEDYRRHAKVAGTSGVPAASPWREALGEPPGDAWEARRHSRLIATLREVRRDIGLDPPPQAEAVGAPPAEMEALAALVARPVSSTRTGPAAGPPPRSPGRVRRH